MYKDRTHYDQDIHEEYHQDIHKEYLIHDLKFGLLMFLGFFVKKRGILKLISTALGKTRFRSLVTELRRHVTVLNPKTAVHRDSSASRHRIKVKQSTCIAPCMVYKPL